MNLPSQMTTVEMREPGEPEVLVLGKRNIPTIGPSEVLIKVIAAGVNGPDLVQRKGHYPPPKGASDLLGLEISGQIVSVGGDQTQWNVGDRVCALTNGGGYAEYVAANANHCLPIPGGVSDIDSAGLPETFFTVWSNVFYNHDIKQESIFLVHGGAGGIGSTAIQIGTAMGLQVFTTVGSKEACSYCKDLGSKRSINYKDEDFVTILREAGGADIILDIIGGDYVARNIRAAKPDARILQLAFNHGSKIELDFMPIMLKRLVLTGSTLRSRPEEFKTAIAKDLRKKVWPFFASTPAELKTTTFARYSFSDAAKAHRQMEKGGHHGKIVLIP